jgi:outer membrane biosynthesis protein TonB
MGKGAILSGLLHLAVVLLAIFGLPWLYNTDEVLQATPVTVISEAQFAALNKEKPPAQQKKQEVPKEQEIPPAPPAPDVAQPQPEPEEPAPPEPAPAAEPVLQPQPPPEPPQQAEQRQPAVQPEPPPEPPQEVVTPEPQPQPKPEPVPPPEVQVAEAQPKPVPPKKPNPPKKKDEPKKKEDTKQKEKPKDEQVASDDTSFLKDIEKKLRKNQKTQQQPQPQQAALPQDNYDGPPLSEGEKDLIRKQITDHTSIDPGMQGLEGFVVEIKVVMNPDGSVQSAVIDSSKSSPHPNWHIFAEACQRGVKKASPLRMPPEKPYAAWQQMTLVFHGKEMAHL